MNVIRKSRMYFTPFKVVDLSVLFILDESISIFRGFWWIFYFYCILHRNFIKQTVLILIRRFVLRRLNRVCTFIIILAPQAFYPLNFSEVMCFPCTLCNIKCLQGFGIKNANLIF